MAASFAAKGQPRAVQFRAYLDTLSPDERHAVVNLLTLGCGRMALAARRALRDEPCHLVLTALGGVGGPLREALRRIGAAAGSPDGQMSGVLDGRHEPRWGAYLASLGPAAEAAIAAELIRVVQQTRALGDAVQADGEVDGIRRDLADVVAAVDSLYQRVLTGG